MSSATKSSKATPGCLFLFFFLIGGLITTLIGFIPAYRMIRAQQWPAVPCRILSSNVGSHSDSDGTTYSIDIVYEYEAGGRVYESDRYDFMGGSSSGYRGKAAIVARHPPGSMAVCYVNPQRPEYAVLNRGFRPVMLMALVPFSFMIIGLVGLLSKLLRQVSPDPVPAASDQNWFAKAPTAPRRDHDPRYLDTSGYR